MTTMISALPRFPSLPQSIHNAVQTIKGIDPAIVKNALGIAKAEAAGMTDIFIKGAAFTWIFGGRNPLAAGTTLALSLPFAKIAYPTFHKLFKCTPATTTRNLVANQLANITAVAAANFAAYQLGFNIIPEEFIVMKIASSLIPTVMTAIDTPLKDLPKLLPEIVTNVALSALFGVSVHRLGYEINPYLIFRVQASLIAMMLNSKQIFSTSMHFALNNMDEETKNEMLQKHPILANINLELPDNVVLKKQVIASSLNFIFNMILGRMDQHFLPAATLTDHSANTCPATGNQSMTHRIAIQ